MLNNQIFQSFCSGFMSVFRFGNLSIKPLKTLETVEYFCHIENDINKSYQELKKR